MLHRRLIIVDTTLALRTVRLAAAKEGEHGLEVLTLPLLAARMAGGFVRPADRAVIYDAVNVALSSESLTELAPVRALPGMPRAVVNSLAGLWNEALPLGALANTISRASDLDRLERSVRHTLPAGMLAPPDLVAAALANTGLCNKLFATVTIRRLVDVDPVWRPLVNAIAERVSVTWETNGAVDRTWFRGTLSIVSPAGGMIEAAEICADPRAEALEALRWVRQLLSSGKVQASEIAIVAAVPLAWDEHLQILSAGSIDIHFCHGRPALATAPGQACAALADILLHGLSQDRIRRLGKLSSYLRTHLPRAWTKTITPGAGLFSAAHWRRAIEAHSDQDFAQSVLKVLVPVLELLEKGIDFAVAAGEVLLAGKSLAPWQDALRRAPAAALPTTLRALRVADDIDPGNSVVWGPAAEIVSAPRKYTRLIGLNARSWPRTETDDALFPARLVPARPDRLSIIAIDRLHFSLLVAEATGGCTASCSARSAEGTLLSPSPLWPSGAAVANLARTRIPLHAANEADRLLARPNEARIHSRLGPALEAWTDWGRREITSHDGRVRPQHPLVHRTFSRPHSSVLLRRLLRDPLGFIWKYGLELHQPRWASRPLELEPSVFGELVHALIKQTIDLLEAGSGMMSATTEEVRSAIGDAARLIQEQWPLTRPVPPPMLWRYTLEDAVRRTNRALTAAHMDEVSTGPGSKTWGELSFGDDRSAEVTPWPKGAVATVAIGTHQVRLTGRIDRLDVGADQRNAMLSDYKTGAVPPSARNLGLDGGREIQRTLRTNDSLAVSVRSVGFCRSSPSGDLSTSP